jgi:hypothetical protein
MEEAHNQQINKKLMGGFGMAYFVDSYELLSHWG